MSQFVTHLMNVKAKHEKKSNKKYTVESIVLKEGVNINDLYLPIKIAQYIQSSDPNWFIKYYVNWQDNDSENEMTEETWDSLLPKIKIIKAQLIDSEKFGINQISHIGFPNLISLTIHDANCKLDIDNFEQIQLIQAPLLKTLSINYTFLSQAKTLRKCTFSRMEHLRLYKNCIKDWNFFNEIQAKQINQLHIDLTNTLITQCQTVNWLLKVNFLSKRIFNNGQLIVLNGQNRISQESAFKQLKSKNQRMVIFKNG